MVSRAGLEPVRATDNTQVIDFTFALIAQSASKSVSWRHFGDSDFGRALTVSPIPVRQTRGRRIRDTLWRLTHQPKPRSIPASKPQRPSVRSVPPRQTSAPRRPPEPSAARYRPCAGNQPRLRSALIRLLNSRSREDFALRVTGATR